MQSWVSCPKISGAPLSWRKDLLGLVLGGWLVEFQKVVYLAFIWYCTIFTKCSEVFVLQLWTLYVAVHFSEWHVMVHALSSVQYQVIFFGNSKMNSPSGPISLSLRMYGVYGLATLVWHLSFYCIHLSGEPLYQNLFYIASVCPLKWHASNWLPKTYEAFVDCLTPIYLTSSECSLLFQMTESHIFIRSNWISQGKKWSEVPHVKCAMKTYFAITPSHSDSIFPAKNLLIIHHCWRWLTCIWWFWYPPWYCMISHDNWNLWHWFIFSEAWVWPSYKDGVQVL